MTNCHAAQLHPSKLELVDAAHSAGYVVVLHVLLIPEELAVPRVASRVQAGGHGVPENKIRERYHRLWAVVVAAARCEEVTMYDNSGSKGPRIVAKLTGGFIVGAPQWLAWSPAELTQRWPR